MKKPPQKKRGSLFTFMTFALVFIILFDPNLRDAVGHGVGLVLNPIIGFGGDYPVLTITIAGTLMVTFTTVIRHFTTDWIDMARFQSYMRAFNKELGNARRENNTYRLKRLQDQQPEVMQRQREVSSSQLKTMPMTMLIVIPLFAWLFTFVDALDYWWYAAPWNTHVDMFTTTGFIPKLGSIFPHWILLYMVLSIPLGALVQKSMKYLSWRERWKARHPGVKE